MVERAGWFKIEHAVIIGTNQWAHRQYAADAVERVKTKSLNTDY